jgi:hypothetical protein
MKDLKLFPTLEAQPPHHFLGVCAFPSCTSFPDFLVKTIAAEIRSPIGGMSEKCNRLEKVHVA